LNLELLKRIRGGERASPRPREAQELRKKDTRQDEWCAEWKLQWHGTTRGGGGQVGIADIDGQHWCKKSGGRSRGVRKKYLVGRTKLQHAEARGKMVMILGGVGWAK